MEDIMSAPAWFNYATYVANKLAQLQSADPEAGWTSESLQAAFTAAGYSNDADGMYQHFVDWGNAENVSPSPYFVVSEYMANKLAQLQSAEPAAGWDMTKLEQAFKDAGLSAWDHYTMYGQDEGISPSSLFDNNAYLAAKLAQLQSTEPDAGWESVDQVVDAFQAAGLNPIEHYMLYGVSEALTYTPVAPVDPETPVTDELTTARDVLNLGAGDHVIGGVASSLSAEKTLNENDLIDGGEGNDTLRVTMNANFNGFTVTDDPNTTGGMKNVENVELTNNGQIARTFSAKGIDGATTYTLKAGEAGTGAINLKDLSAAGITVNVDGLQSGSTSVDFATGALDGTEDNLTLGLTNVGTAPTADGDDAISVNVSASSGLESVTINASGPNYVDLSGVDAPSLAMTGSGALNISAVNAALESFDGSAATGNVAADLSGADEISSIIGTQGDDTFTVKNLNPVATLDGGAGNDTLWLDGFGGTLQPTVSGFETIGVRDTTGTGLTLSGKNAQDFNAVSLEDATVTLASLNASTFTVTSQGEEGTVNSATLSDAVQLTVNVESTADAAATQNITTTITASNATDAVINVGANVAAAGAFNFAKAQSVQLNVTGNVVDGVNQTSFGAALSANNATDLTVTAGADVTLTAGSNLSKVQSLNITQNDYAFDAKTNAIDFAALNSLNISGSGKDSAAKFGDLGLPMNTYRLNVTADGLAAGLELGDVSSADDVTLDFANVTGDVKTGDIFGNNVSVQVARLGGESTIGAINASGNVTVDASGNLADTLSIGAITLQGEVKTNAAVSVTVDGSAALTLGNIDADDATKGTVTLDLSGYLGHNNTAVTGPTISGNTVNVYGSELVANTFNSITANTLTFTGGLANDTVTLTGVTGQKAIKATLDTGAGADRVSITGDAATETITVSGDMGGDANSNDTITINADQGNAAGVTIDISKLGGYSTSDITGVSAQSDIIIGGSGNDTITAGAVQFASVTDTPAKQGSATYIINFGSNGFAVDANISIGDVQSTSTVTVSPIMTVDALMTFINTTDSTGLGAKWVATKDASGNLVLTEKSGQEGQLLKEGSPVPVITASGTSGSSDATASNESVDYGHAEIPGGTVHEAIFDTLTGGAGADEFILSVAAGSSDKNDGPTTIITDFKATELDTLKIGSIGAGNNSNYVKSDSYDDLVALLTAANDALDGTIKYFAAMVDNDTYIVASNNADQHEAIVQLQGVSLDQLDDTGSFITA